MKEQANSFACMICGEVFTEESGASRGFVCDNCHQADIETASRILEMIAELKGKPKMFDGERWYAYEDSIIELLHSYSERTTL